MKPRLSRIMERDSERCGIHSGGCLQTISYNAEGDQAATEDHMVPRKYATRMVQNFSPHKDWNLQPMHKKCNILRRGQILGSVKFECDCHGSYIDEQQNRWMMYKENENWQKTKYKHWGSKLSYGNIPGGMPAGMFMSTQIIMTKTKTGMHFNIAGRGHSFVELEFYYRLLHNAREFNRTKQWTTLANEIEKICEQIAKDGGTSFRKEAHNEYSLAEIIHWANKAKEKTSSQNITGTHTGQVCSGSIWISGLSRQKALDQALRNWYNEAQNEAWRCMMIGKHSEQESICTEAVQKSERPNAPETPKAIATFYYMKIAAQKAQRGQRQGASEEAQEAAAFFEDLANGDHSTIEADVKNVIEQRDLPHIAFISEEIVNIFTQIMWEHIRNGKIAFERPADVPTPPQKTG